MSGDWLALGAVAALALAGARRGSRGVADPRTVALDALEQRLRSQEPALTKLVLLPWNKPSYKTIVLHSIEVDQTQRKRGVGERTLAVITAWADANDQTILLTPQGSKRRLERWYRRHGFVRNKGRNKDFRYWESMYRRPRQGSRSQTAVAGAVQRGSRNRDLSSLDLVEIREKPGHDKGSALWATGTPITFDFAHNTEPSPYFGARYGQDLEPAGRYVISFTLAPRHRIPGHLYGTIHFDNPIVLASTWPVAGEYGGAEGWKHKLSALFGGKRGLPLTRALVAAGYDGIVTVTMPRPDSRQGPYLSEIVELSTMSRKKPPRRRGSSNTDQALVRQIQSHLSPDLLDPSRKVAGHGSQAGHCYVASQALWHLLGNKRSGYTPQVGPAPGGGTHWWLRQDRTGRVLDPTASQFPRYDYSQGIGKGFQTKQPSKRAAVLIGRVQRGSRSVIDVLQQRDQAAFQQWLTDWLDNDKAEIAEALADRQIRLDYFTDYLSEHPGLTVRDDGLIEVEFTDLASVDPQLLGDLPLALYHGTSTALLPSIRRQGLRPARVPQQRSDKTYSTMAGVYLSTRYDVGVYAGMAVHQHGGDPVILTVRTTRDQLAPDPDDEHLYHTGAMQWITPWVAPGDIVEGL